MVSFQDKHDAVCHEPLLKQAPADALLQMCSEQQRIFVLCRH